MSSVFVTNFSCCNKSRSAGKDVGAEHGVDGENVDICDQEHNCASGNAAVTGAVTDAGREQRITDDGVIDMLDSHNPPRDQHGCLRPFHHSPEVADILKVVDDTYSSRQGDTDESCGNGRRPLSGAVYVHKSDICSKGRRLRPPSSDKSPEIPDILEVIDDACSSRQGDSDCSNGRRPSSESAHVSKCDTRRASSAREHVNVRKHAVHSVNSRKSDYISADVMDMSTPEPGQSLQRACSEAIKIRLVPRKRSQTRLATPGCARKVVLPSPGRAGNLRRATPGRAGKMALTSPGRSGKLRHATPGHAGKMVVTSPGHPHDQKLTTSVCTGNPKQTTPIRAGKTVLTSPGRTGNPRHGTPGHAGNLKQTTPGRAGNKRRAVPPGGLATPKNGTWTTQGAIAQSPGFARLCVSSPALKRNAKGETALHRAAIKVTSLDQFLVIVNCHS